jgi:hypothetical protein
VPNTTAKRSVRDTETHCWRTTSFHGDGKLGSNGGNPKELFQDVMTAGAKHCHESRPHSLDGRW